MRRCYNDSRVIVGNYFRIGQLCAFLAIPELTPNVSGPAVHSSVANPVHLIATTGVNRISYIEVWTNSKEVFRVKSGHLDAALHLPTGTNQRMAIQAVDAKGIRAEVETTITVA
jgi:hypothetical protein